MSPTQPAKRARAPRARNPLPDRYVHLLVSALWSTGPLAALGDRERMLWLRLATGPETTTIPGVLVVGAEDIARSLGWSPEEVQAIASKIPAASLRADWRAGVVWLPHLIRWQAPRSPKNILGWRGAWRALPTTPIADEIHEEMRIVCEGRGEAFARAMSMIPPQPRPPVRQVPATIDIDGVTVTMSGIPEHGRAALLLELARGLGVPIMIEPVAAVAMLPAPPAPPAAIALPTMEDLIAPTRPRRTKLQLVLDERAVDLDRILRYQAARREEAFALAGKAPTPLDAVECRRLIATLIAAGRTVVECEQAIDRQYEKVGAETSPAARLSAAQWWTHSMWQARTFAELLRLDLGGAAAQGVGGLAAAVNKIAPSGATSIAPCSIADTRPLSQLLLDGHQAPEILVTAEGFAAVVAEQEHQLARRQPVDGEARLVKLWGPRIFRTAAWSAVQTAVEHFEAGERGPDLFTGVSAALMAGAAKGRAVAAVEGSG